MQGNAGVQGKAGMRDARVHTRGMGDGGQVSTQERMKRVEICIYDK